MVQKTKKVTGKTAIKKTVEKAIEKEYGKKKVLEAANSQQTVDDCMKAVEEVSDKLANGKDKPEGYTFGRPTKYDSKYCNMLIDYFKDAPLFEIDIQTYMDKNGNEQTKEIKRPAPQPSIIRFAAIIGVDDTTIYEWCKQHPDFSRAKKAAKKFQEVWLNEAAGAFGYNPSIAIIQLKHNHGYRETSVVEGRNTNVNVEAKASDTPVDQMTDEQKADVQDQLKAMGFTTTNDFLTAKVVQEDENKENE